MPSKDLINTFFDQKSICNLPQEAVGYFLFSIPFKSFVYVCQDMLSLKAIHKEALSFNSSLNILIYPEWDVSTYANISPSQEVKMRQASILSKANQPVVILTTLKAFLQKVPQQLSQPHMTFSIKVGKDLDIYSFTTYLQKSGFERVTTVYDTAQYSVRGGIIDVFVPESKLPYRIDLFGETVDSIKYFDPSSQRSEGEELEEITISSNQGINIDEESLNRLKTNFFTHFGMEHRDNQYVRMDITSPPPGWEHLYSLMFESMLSLKDIFSDRPIFLPSKAYFQDFAQQMRSIYEDRKFMWNQGKESQRMVPPVPIDMLFDTDDLCSGKNIHIVSAMKVKEGTDFGYRILPPAHGDTLYEKIGQHLKAAKGLLLIIILDTETDIQHLKNMCAEHAIPINEIIGLNQAKLDGVNLWKSFLLKGFYTDKFYFLSEMDLFGKRQKPYKKSSASARKIEDIIQDANSIGVGDIVVHRNHGLGRYLGLETVQVNHLVHDCFKLEYSGNDKLFLPVENSDLLSRYGDEDSKASLDKLGGVAWENRQKGVKKKLRSLASYLMKIAAARKLKKAPVFCKNVEIFDEFVSHFPYAETEDQLNAINDVLEDLEKGIAMDRLICGDVGFGKTEVALRAAFLVAYHGCQVAIVTPTTLLARQHYTTFQERLKGFNLKVRQLSRLVKASEAQEIRRDLADGKIDIVIGTHALLSKTVRFKDLQLLIVDEEQSFGVKQKEKLKELAENVHVLTLTATPIPRTLQMSLLGVRDLSIISTPPVDRLAIQTTIMEEDYSMISQAIELELKRGGQVFYVCPRIQDIEEIETYLKKLPLAAKVAVAHGQMTSETLENRISEFMDKQYDVLISTSIIESGIDIPNVNTMIIHNAHMFGLSQLYQLRGRIGRSNRQAFAYLMLPSQRKLGEKSLKRLHVMSTLDSLGAGFQLASHDMDIRGAGNLLGEEQSGHIKEVGVELYQELLKEAVDKLRKEDITDFEGWSPQLSLGISVSLTESYIADLDTRMNLYRRIGHIESQTDIENMRGELVDRFGPLPTMAENLLKTIEIKLLCKQAFIQKLDVGPSGFVMAFKNNLCPYAERLLGLISSNRQYKIRGDQTLFYASNKNNMDERLDELKKSLGEILVLKDDF